MYDNGQPTMTPAYAKAKYGDLVRLQMTGRRFLTDEKERQLLEDGLTQYGLSLDDARGVVRSAAEERQVTMQRDVEDSAGHMLRESSSGRGAISRKDFLRVAGYYSRRAEGALPQDQINSRIKAMMEQNKLSPKRAGLFMSRSWYNKIK